MSLMQRLYGEIARAKSGSRIDSPVPQAQPQAQPERQAQPYPSAL